MRTSLIRWHARRSLRFEKNVGKVKHLIKNYYAAAAGWNIVSCESINDYSDSNSLYPVHIL